METHALQAFACELSRRICASSSWQRMLNMSTSSCALETFRKRMLARLFHRSVSARADTSCRHSQCKSVHAEDKSIDALTRQAYVHNLMAMLY